MSFSKFFRFFFVITATCIVFISCFRGPDKNREVLAQVKNAYLYADEIEGMIPVGLSESDSLELLNVYIQSWVEKQLILQDANKTLTAREKDFNQKIRDYRDALLIFQWERKILEEKMDTTVSEKEMKSYYDTNQHEFILQADIVRVLYIKLNANSNLRNDAYQLISSETFDRNKTEQFCSKYAVNYFLDLNAWLYVEDLLKEIPLNQQQKQDMLTGNTFIEMKDDEYVYLLKVTDVKIKGSVSPFALEQNTIRDIILQKRKKDIIDQQILDIKNNTNQSDIQIFIQ